MKSNEDGSFINNLDMARQLYDSGMTPGQYGHQLISDGKHYIPDFYRSDLLAELDKIWAYQHQYHSAILTTDFRNSIDGQSRKGTSLVFSKTYGIYTADFKKLKSSFL